MSSNNKAVLDQFLRSNGVGDSALRERIAGGFDFRHPIYTSLIEPGDHLFQYMRREEIGSAIPGVGNWFCLRGADMGGLAIFSGGPGRLLKEFTVSRPVVGLEGTAAPMNRNWDWAGGGPGGSTQIYLPYHALMALVGLGTHLDGF
jgi:hypothetical protein